MSTAFREDARKLRAVLDSLPDAVIVADATGALVEFNPAAERLNGVGLSSTRVADWAAHYGIFLPDAETPCPADQVPLARALRGEDVNDVELFVRRPDGSGSYVEVTGRPVLDANGRIAGAVVIFSDVTRRREADRELRRLNRIYDVLMRVSQVIVHATDTQQLFAEACRVAVQEGRLRMAWVGTIDADGNVVPVAMSGEILGYLDNINISARGDVREGQGPTGRAVREGRTVVCRDIAREPAMQPWREAALARGYRSSAAFPLRVADHVIGAYTVYSSEVGWFGEEELQLLEVLAADISFGLEALERARAREHAEGALRRREAELREAQRIGAIGSWEWDVATNVIAWSDQMYRIFGRTMNDVPATYEALLDLYAPESAARLNSAVQRAIATGEPYEEDLEQASGGRWITSRGEAIRDPAGTIVGLRGTAQDITARKTSENALKESAAEYRKLAIERERTDAALADRTRELERSNAELEQFAYVASHDLQEPLRMVASYTQLLARRYQGKLDADADEYIGYAVEGARRMQRLLLDLLALSRVATRARPIGPVSTEAAFRAALDNLKIGIEESGALVTADPLPMVVADDVQLVQLFQNLIGNALKFRSVEPPVIHVGATRRGTQWEFAVRDNGIGIDPQFRDRIFLMFQRLHPVGLYEGSGIGLAICQKIVTRHGGEIWVESQPGRGATFHFTLAAVALAFEEDVRR